MTDMSAFERRVADGMIRRAGPIRPVDDLAIFDAITASSRSRKWGFTMFSAARFVAASIIVALFGGFLLAGVVTTPVGDDVIPAAATASASPDANDTAANEVSVRTDLVPGVELEVEEVESGVFRVVSDRVHSPIVPSEKRQDPNLFDEDWLLAGLDGSVWLIEDDALVKLGRTGRLAHPKSWYGYEFGVAADGTPWIAAEDKLYSWNGRKWRVRLDAKEHDVEMHGTIGFQLTADGDVVVRLNNTKLQHSDGKRWSDLPSPPVPAGRRGAALIMWSVDDGPTIWAVRGGGQRLEAELSRFDGTRWETVADLLPAAGLHAGSLATVGDEIRVFYGQAEFGVSDDAGLLPRIEVLSPSGEWARLDVPPVPGWHGGVRADMARLEPGWVFELAPDGTFWKDLSHVDCRPGTGGQGCEPYVTACEGLAHFDDGRWTRYLHGLCVAEVEFSPDGSVWAVAATPTPGEVVTAAADGDAALAGGRIETLELGPSQLYVITSGALTATR